MYCEGAIKAKVSFTQGGIQKYYLVENTNLLPITVECVQAGETIYAHPMTTPINQEFGTNIISVSLQNSNNTYRKRANEPSTEETCPIPSIIGTKLQSFFDESGVSGVNWYSDNSGICTYKVVLKGGLKIKSGNKILLELTDVDCNSVLVSCGDECPPHHIKCKCDSYPGYCCVPCAEIEAGIRAATGDLRRVNNG